MADLQRTLTAEFPPFNAVYDTELSPPAWAGYSTGYQQLYSNIWVNEVNLDLSGYALQKKSFFPYSSFQQVGGLFSGQWIALITQQPYLSDTVLVSSVPLDNTALLQAASEAPGFTQFSGSVLNYNRDVIIHGESRTYTVDSSLSVAGGYNTLTEVDRHVFSSLEPTAADRLYGYRLILISEKNGQGEGVTLPPLRVIMPGTITEEPKAEYMMRLKRSYELANQV